MTDLVGRRLPIPPVRYKTPVRRRDAKFGGWTMQGLRFHNPKKLDNWIVVHFKLDGPNTENDLQRTVKNFIEELILNGMSVEAPRAIWTVKIENTADPSVGKVLRRISELGYKLALIVLPRDDTQLYQRIKTAGDIHGGYHTACVIEKKFMGKGGNDRQYFSNVSLKINLKLGGTNHIVAEDKDLPFVSEGDTMIVSYDVTHPPPAPKSSSTIDKQTTNSKKSATGTKSLFNAKSTPGPARNSTARKAKAGPKYNPAGLKVSDNL